MSTNPIFSVQTEKPASDVEPVMLSVGQMRLICVAFTSLAAEESQAIASGGSPSALGLLLAAMDQVVVQMQRTLDGAS